MAGICSASSGSPAKPNEPASEDRLATGNTTLSSWPTPRLEVLASSGGLTAALSDNREVVAPASGKATDATDTTITADPASTRRVRFHLRRAPISCAPFIVDLPVKWRPRPLSGNL